MQIFTIFFLSRQFLNFASSNHFTPCISFFTNGLMRMISVPATAGTMVNIKKKVDKLYSLVILSICPPTTAANLCPIATAKYHTPNIKAIIRAGTNLDTYDNPTGDRHSSPIVLNI